MTVKIQFDNARTCKYSIIFNLHTVTMSPRAIPPPFKNSGSAPEVDYAVYIMLQIHSKFCRYSCTSISCTTVLVPFLPQDQLNYFAADNET